MNASRTAQWIVFAAALGMGYGCGGAAPQTARPTPAGKTYKEKYTCNEQFGGVPPTTCPDLNVVDEIAFQSTGPDTFDVRDVPDLGFLMTGTMSGNTFVWSATSPNGYTETGTWTFSADFTSFSGSSHYVANDNSYAGDCNANGLQGSTVPADPPLPSGCP